MEHEHNRLLVHGNSFREQRLIANKAFETPAQIAERVAAALPEKQRKELLQRIQEDQSGQNVLDSVREGLQQTEDRELHRVTYENLRDLEKRTQTELAKHEWQEFLGTLQRNLESPPAPKKRITHLKQVVGEMPDIQEQENKVFWTPEKKRIAVIAGVSIATAGLAYWFFNRKKKPEGAKKRSKLWLLLPGVGIPVGLAYFWDKLKKWDLTKGMANGAENFVNSLRRKVLPKKVNDAIDTGTKVASAGAQAMEKGAEGLAEGGSEVAKLFEHTFGATPDKIDRNDYNSQQEYEDAVVASHVKHHGLTGFLHGGGIYVYGATTDLYVRMKDQIALPLQRLFNGEGVESWGGVGLELLKLQVGGSIVYGASFGLIDDVTQIIKLGPKKAIPELLYRHGFWQLQILRKTGVTTVAGYFSPLKGGKITRVGVEAKMSAPRYYFNKFISGKVPGEWKLTDIDHLYAQWQAWYKLTAKLKGYEDIDKAAKLRTSMFDKLKSLRERMSKGLVAVRKTEVANAISLELRKAKVAGDTKRAKHLQTALEYAQKGNTGEALDLANKVGASIDQFHGVPPFVQQIRGSDTVNLLSQIDSGDASNLTILGDDEYLKKGLGHSSATVDVSDIDLPENVLDTKVTAVAKDGAEVAVETKVTSEAVETVADVPEDILDEVIQKPLDDIGLKPQDVAEASTVGPPNANSPVRSVPDDTLDGYDLQPDPNDEYKLQPDPNDEYKLQPLEEAAETQAPKNPAAQAFNRAMAEAEMNAHALEHLGLQGSQTPPSVSPAAAARLGLGNGEEPPAASRSRLPNKPPDGAAGAAATVDNPRLPDLPPAAARISEVADVTTSPRVRLAAFFLERWDSGMTAGEAVLINRVHDYGYARRNPDGTHSKRLLVDLRKQLMDGIEHNGKPVRFNKEDAMTLIEKHVCGDSDAKILARLQKLDVVDTSADMVMKLGGNEFLKRAVKQGVPESEMKALIAQAEELLKGAEAADDDTLKMIAGSGWAVNRLIRAAKGGNPEEVAGVLRAAKYVRNTKVVLESIGVVGDVFAIAMAGVDTYQNFGRIKGASNEELKALYRRAFVAYGIEAGEGVAGLGFAAFGGSLSLFALPAAVAALGGGLYYKELEAAAETWLKDERDRMKVTDRELYQEMHQLKPGQHSFGSKVVYGTNAEWLVKEGIIFHAVPVAGPLLQSTWKDTAMYRKIQKEDDRKFQRVEAANTYARSTIARVFCLRSAAQYVHPREGESAEERTQRFNDFVSDMLSALMRDTQGDFYLADPELLENATAHALALSESRLLQFCDEGKCDTRLGPVLRTLRIPGSDETIDLSEYESIAQKVHSPDQRTKEEARGKLGSMLAAYRRNQNLAKLTQIRLDAQHADLSNRTEKAIVVRRAQLLLLSGISHHLDRLNARIEEQDYPGVLWSDSYARDVARYMAYRAFRSSLVKQARRLAESSEPLTDKDFAAALDQIKADMGWDAMTYYKRGEQEKPNIESFRDRPDLLSMQSIASGLQDMLKRLAEKKRIDDEFAAEERKAA